MTVLPPYTVPLRPLHAMARQISGLVCEYALKPGDRHKAPRHRYTHTHTHIHIHTRELDSRTRTSTYRTPKCIKGAYVQFSCWLHIDKTVRLQTPRQVCPKLENTWEPCHGVSQHPLPVFHAWIDTVSTHQPGIAALAHYWKSVQRQNRPTGEKHWRR
jgi:hypothetical protein